MVFLGWGCHFGTSRRFGWFKSPPRAIFRFYGRLKYMALGRKTGGRTKGTPNKLTSDARSRLEALGCDPIEGMAVIAMDANNPMDLRGRMFAELAQYVYPKRKAVEHTGPGGGPIEHAISAGELLADRIASIAAHTSEASSTGEPHE